LIKVTVPIEFNLTIDNATAKKINSGEISRGDFYKEVDYKLDTTVRQVLASLSSPDFKDRIIDACWAKIHAPK